MDEREPLKLDLQPDQMHGGIRPVVEATSCPSRRRDSPVNDAGVEFEDPEGWMAERPDYWTSRSRLERLLIHLKTLSQSLAGARRAHPNDARWSDSAWRSTSDARGLVDQILRRMGAIWDRLMRSGRRGSGLERAELLSEAEWIVKSESVLGPMLGPLLGPLSVGGHSQSAKVVGKAGGVGAARLADAAETPGVVNRGIAGAVVGLAGGVCVGEGIAAIARFRANIGVARPAVWLCRYGCADATTCIHEDEKSFTASHFDPSLPAFDVRTVRANAHLVRYGIRLLPLMERRLAQYGSSDARANTFPSVVGIAEMAPSLPSDGIGQGHRSEAGQDAPVSAPSHPPSPPEKPKRLRPR